MIFPGEPPVSKQRTNALKKNLILFFLTLLFCLIFSEFVLYVLASKGLLKIEKPSYAFDTVRKKFWADVNVDFGVWHEPYSQYHHRKSCIDVTYHANSYGARDKERQKISNKPRVVVLGDSFVEGYCLGDGKRFTDLLEKDSGVEYLNFGTAGYFGTTQYYLLYKTLAKSFSHSGVLIAILPFNDFFDNDFEIGKKVHKHRYRPYFVGKYPDYKLIYFHQEDLGQETAWVYEALRWVRGFLRGYTYTYNAITGVIDFRTVKQAYYPGKKIYSGFYDFTEEQYQLMQFTLEKIIEEAQGKDVTLVTIPVLNDFKRYDALGESPLSKKLRAFTQARGVQYIDLLPAMHDYTQDWSQYYFTCDGHWSEFGSKVAFQILKDQLPKYIF